MDKYYNITLRFNDRLGFHIPPSSYLKTINGDCHNLIIYNPNVENVILGDVFFENYYTVYDFENSLIGFNGWVQDELDILPKSPPRKSHTEFTLYVIIIALLFIIVVGGFVMYCRKNNKLDNSLASHN